MRISLKKKSRTHNKNQILLLNFLLIAYQKDQKSKILSIKDERAFLFLKLLRFGFCNSSANFLFDILPFLISPPQIFRPFKQADVDIHHISDFC